MTARVNINLATWEPPAPPPEDDAEAIIDWAVDRFSNHVLAMTTSFGMESIALMDLLAQRTDKLLVIYVDTGFLFRETLELRDQLVARYPSFRFERVAPLITPEEQAVQFDPELWQRDPDLCCRIRKVEPLHRAIQGIDVWFTSIRRDQSPSRWNTKIVDWNWKFQLLKVCPLVSWSRPRVYEYIVERSLPYNRLHDECYPSIGCTHCTRPVNGAKPWEYSRDGRWNNRDKTECGLHEGGGI